MSKGSGVNKFNLWIFLLLVISSIILGFVVYQVTVNIQNLIKQNVQIDRTNQRLVKLSDVVSDMHAVQALVRSYLITDDKQFRANYQIASSTLDIDVTGLQSVASDDPQQREQAGRLVNLVYAHMTAMDAMLKRYEHPEGAVPPRTLRASLATEEGEPVLALITQMKTDELGKLSQYRALSGAGLTTTITVSVVGVGTCILIFLFLFWLIDREGVRRGLHEQSLKSMVTQMELIQGELRQMGSLTEYLQSCRELEEIYALVGRHVSEMFPQVQGILGVYNTSRNVIEIVSSWADGMAREVGDINYFLPEDCWALRRGAVHLVTAQAHNPRCTHMDHPTGDAVCFPMVAHGETIGVLHIFSSSAGKIDVRMQQLLRGISEHVSMAIANMRLEKTLRIQSLRDPLTHLYNRRYMESSLEREIFRAKRKKEPVSIIMIDIDHFKRFNDTFGHEAGDTVLREFASLLTQAIRGEDIACRYGGEEFILILPGAACAIAVSRAEKLRNAMPQMKLTHQGVTLNPVTLSLGVITYPEHCDNPTELVKKADEALYRAKRAGRNRVEVAGPLSSA